MPGPEYPGEHFFNETRHVPGKTRPRRPPVHFQPVKNYPGSTVFPLPAPGVSSVQETGNSRMAFREIVGTRKSVREFANEPMRLEDLSFLLWASGGQGRIEDGFRYRTIPSAGARYPLETYVCTRDVTGIEAGLYHFNVMDHSLEQIRKGELSREIALAALGQEMCQMAQATIIWSAVVERCRSRYGERAYRYMFLDAGHAGHALALAAVSRGLGTCQIAAYLDDEMDRLLGLDGVEESVVYMSVMGHPQDG